MALPLFPVLILRLCPIHVFSCYIWNCFKVDAAQRINQISASHTTLHGHFSICECMCECVYKGKIPFTWPLVSRNLKVSLSWRLSQQHHPLPFPWLILRVFWEKPKGFATATSNKTSLTQLGKSKFTQQRICWSRTVTVRLGPWTPFLAPLGTSSPPAPDFSQQRNPNYKQRFQTISLLPALCQFRGDFLGKIKDLVWSVH